MPDLKRKPRPWDEVIPDQPVARIDPLALAESMNPSPTPSPLTSSDAAYLLALKMAERQEAAAKLGQANAQVLQDSPLTLGTLWDLMEGWWKPKKKEGK